MLNSVTAVLLVLLDNLSYASLVLSIFIILMILIYVCLLIPVVHLSFIYHFPQDESRHFLRTEARIYRKIVNYLQTFIEKRNTVDSACTNMIAHNTDKAKGKQIARTMVLQDFTPPGFRTTSATSLKNLLPMTHNL